jgi:hypothetical protein
MSGSRKTSIYWGAGVAIFLAAYVASPPLLVLATRGGSPGPRIDAILTVAYWPLQKLYEVSPWYKRYINSTYRMVTP